MKYSLLAAIFAGVVLPGSATSAGDTPASPGTIVEKEGGIVKVASKHSVDETVDRLKNILQSKQITLFALVDHSGEAVVAASAQTGPYYGKGKAPPPPVDTKG